MEKTGDPQSPGGLRILMVEDNADTAEMTALALRLHGHEVRIALDGPTVLRMAQVQRPDVVLLDIGLPQMDGWEVARRLRKQTGPGEKPPLLIAITGYGGRENERRSKDAGIDLHFVKPVDMEELQGILSRFHASLDDK